MSILKLTKNGPVSHELINRDIRVPTEVAKNSLQKLANDGLIYVHGMIVEADSGQRLGLGVRALRAGADVERVSNCLQWKEFEEMAAVAFERNGYAVSKNLRFKHGGRKWEIDIIGCKGPMIVSVDCKHWHHGLQKSALMKIVREQIERTCALIRSLPNPAVRIKYTPWSKTKFIPVVLSLFVDESKFYDSVPVVPVLQLQDFLIKLPAHADSLLCLTSDSIENFSPCQKRLA